MSNQPIQLPIVLDLRELKHRLLKKVTGPFVLQKHCTFRSAHYSDGIISDYLMLNDVSVPYRSGFFQLDHVQLVLRGARIIFVSNPKALGIDLTLMTKKPIRLIQRQAESFEGKKKTIWVWPRSVIAEGIILQFEHADSMTEWQKSLAQQLENAYDITTVFKLKLARGFQPRAPVPTTTP